MREAIWQAVFEKVQALASFSESSRKLKHWADCVNFPALFLNQEGESVAKSGRGLPKSYTMSAGIYLYVRNESDGTPATQINNLIDVVDAAFQPTTPDGRNTLGGLVVDAWIDGEIARDDGMLGDIGVAIIPIKILISH